MMWCCAWAKSSVGFRSARLTDSPSSHTSPTAFSLPFLVRTTPSKISCVLISRPSSPNRLSTGFCLRPVAESSDPEGEIGGVGRKLVGESDAALLLAPGVLIRYAQAALIRSAIGGKEYGQWWCR